MKNSYKNYLIKLKCTIFHQLLDNFLSLFWVGCLIQCFLEFFLQRKKIITPSDNYIIFRGWENACQRVFIFCTLCCLFLIWGRRGFEFEWIRIKQGGKECRDKPHPGTFLLKSYLNLKVNRLLTPDQKWTEREELKWSQNRGFGARLIG